MSALGNGAVTIEPEYGGDPFERACATLVLVTAPLAADALYHALMEDEAALAQAGIRRVTRIGDCLAPGTIAAAVYGGHRYARELGAARCHALPARVGGAQRRLHHERRIIEQLGV